MTLNTPTLDRLQAGLAGVIDQGIADAASAIVIRAQEFVPVDTGALRDSIHVEGAEGSETRTVIAGGGDVHYAAAIEYGTRFSAAQPFFTPAVEEVDVAGFVRARVDALIGGG